ncbi:MAG: sodium:proton antiporter [Pyrinomonadaceae bacterium]|nr:sodium:proton antiporter [Pyrinomonadaceae bacterium]
MNFEIIFVFAVLALAVYLFVTEKLPVDLVALLVMALLLVSGIISPAEGLSGFSNTATITVGAMFVLSAGLFKTGAVNFLGAFVNQIFKKSFLTAMLVVMCLVGVLSAFINNTPVIAIFLPILLGVAKDTKISASKILMPISFASMFGGVCTLIGTSTNILVSSIAEKQGLPPFSMFEFAPLGLIMFAVGTAYMLLIGIKLIPERRGEGDLTETFALSEYLTEIILLPDALSVGREIKDAPLVHDLDIAILEIRRLEETIHLPTGEVVLQAGDVLLVRCDLEKIRVLQERTGVRLKPQAKWGDESISSEDYRLLEAVVSPNSALVGSTLKKSDFRENYGATVLAIRHRGRILREKLSETVLGAGDLLLIEIHRTRLNVFKRNDDFIVTSEKQTVEFRRGKVAIAAAIVAGVVLAASLNLAPIVVAAVLGAILLILLGCITLDEAYQAIEWKIIFLLAGVLSLGIALEKSGAAQMISTQIVSSVGTFGLIALVSAFYLLTSVLTETMSNNATAALLAPIAIATAATLGVNPQPFLVAVTFAASASFMTPVGYQTNTMIYGPGQYKFFDFVRVGTPLNIIFWLLATFLIPVFWKF